MGVCRSYLIFVVGMASLGISSCSPSGDRIVRVGRQNNSGTYHYFRETVLGEGREYKLGSIDQSGSKDVVALVGNTPSAIGYSGMAYATADVKMVKISRTAGQPGIAPTVENARDGTYPIARPLIIYSIGEPKGAIKGYLDWIFSPAGQKIVEKVGYVPIGPTSGGEETGSAPAAEGESVGPQTIRVTGSDTMVNLAQAWAERYGAEHPYVSVQVQGGGSGYGISGLINGTVDLANASRRMEPSEIDRTKEKYGVAPKEFIVGRDALAVYVNKANPIDSLSLEELAEIYGDGGQIERWSQLKR